MVKATSDHIEIYNLPEEDPVEYFCGILEEGSSLTKALLKDRKEEKRKLLRHSNFFKGKRPHHHRRPGVQKGR
jgi:hypothetical protein